MTAEGIEDTYPLTPMQQGMLFHSMADPQSGLYIQQMICTLQEELDVSAFQWAWEQVVARHAILRTSFRWEGLDEPLQDVHVNVSLPFEEQDWRSYSSLTQQSKFEEFLKLDRHRGFDFAKAPLMRLTLFQLGDAYHQLVWTNHHIIGDGHSRYIILNELYALYDAFCQGLELVLERPRPYREHISWLQKKGSSASEPYWRQMQCVTANVSCALTNASACS